VPEGTERMAQLLEVAQIAQTYYSAQNAARIDTRVLEAVVVLIDAIMAAEIIQDTDQIHELTRRQGTIMTHLAKVREDATPPLYHAVTRIVEVTSTILREARPVEEVRRELAGVMKKLDGIMTTLEGKE